MSILVVGGAGHVGSAIVEAVSGAGLTVHALVRRPAPRLEAYAQVHVGDARRGDLGLDPDVATGLAAEVDAVVFCAGTFDLSISLSAAQAEHLAPLRGALAFAGRCTGLRSFVLLSSLLAIGDVRRRVRSDLMPDPVRHRNFYEWAKLQGEQIARHSGLPVDVVRAGHVLGRAEPDPDRPGVARPQALLELLPLLAAGWPLPIVGTNRYWCCPPELVAQVVLDRVQRGSGGSSVWAVDPGSPTMVEILDLVNARYGMRVKRVRSAPLARTLAAVVRPGWLDLSVRREVLDYCTAHWDLDLGCLSELTDAGRVTPPADRGYLVRTLDHEMARLRELA